MSSENLQLSYQVSDEYRSSQFVVTGSRPAVNHSVVVNSFDLSPQARKNYENLVQAQGRAPLRLPKQDSAITSEHVPTILAAMAAELKEKQDAAKAELDQLILMVTQEGFVPQHSWNGLGRDCDRLAATANVPKDYLQPFRAARKVAEALEEEQRKLRQARQEEERQRKEAEAEAAKEQREQEKRAWIAENGSDYLRECFGRGYRCHRPYIEERLNIELAGFVPDWDDNLRWKERSCPSREALEILKALPNLEFQIVWLTRRHDDEYDDETQREAIVLQGYLGYTVDIVRYV